LSFSQVKTIGDAYIVCCGAFGEATTAAEAARRVTSMGISMLDVVAATAREQQVDIGIRIGIHTGMNTATISFFHAAVEKDSLIAVLRQ